MSQSKTMAEQMREEIEKKAGVAGEEYTTHPLWPAFESELVKMQGPGKPIPANFPAWWKMFIAGANAEALIQAKERDEEIEPVI